MRDLWTPGQAGMPENSLAMGSCSTCQAMSRRPSDAAANRDVQGGLGLGVLQEGCFKPRDHGRAHGSCHRVGTAAPWSHPVSQHTGHGGAR